MDDDQIPHPLLALTDEQLAADPRIGMQRMVFEFLLQQDYFATAASMVAEYIGTIHRLEAAERSGELSSPSVKAAAVLWRNEIRGFKYWFCVRDDDAIARLMREMKDKGTERFVADLTVALQIDH